MLNASEARLINPHELETLDVMGPTIQILAQSEMDGVCFMRGTIPPGVFVPLHSHPDFETFIQLSGELEGLRESGGDFQWLRLRPGDVFHVPSGARHAFRNRSQEPSVGIVASTAAMGRFFREIGTRIVPGGPPLAAPSAEVIRHFLETAAKYGHWNGTREENARVGLQVPGA